MCDNGVCECPNGEKLCNGQCITGCCTDSDCSGSTPYCNTTTHTCVQCLSDSDCSCAKGTPVCSNNQCGCAVECSTSSSGGSCGCWPNGEVCDQGSSGACPSDCSTSNCNLISCYVDNDGDGYGTGSASLYCDGSCPPGYASNNEDCNDNNASVTVCSQPYPTCSNGQCTCNGVICDNNCVVGGKCCNNTDCPSGDICSNNVCTPSGTL